MLATHVAGACLIPNKQGGAFNVGPLDTDCGCISALKFRADAALSKGITTVDRAQSARFCGKGLVFANRASEGIRYTQEATNFFVAKYGATSIDGLVLRADLAMAKGCCGSTHWKNALSMWCDILRDLQCVPQSQDAIMLRKQIACDKFFAESTMYTDINDRARALHKAFEAGHPIQHPFLMRIIVDLEIIGTLAQQGTP